MGVRVLIVEDEQITAADLEAKLTKMGLDVVGTAASGEEAVPLAETSRPEVVLMDIRLQGQMTGIEAARIIQRKTAAQIIFVTSYATIFLRDPTLMPPPGLCLSKPFSEFQLRSALDAVLNNPA